ncbi:MAG: hypothetical protein J7K78_05450 [Thaumarchaeota archaeon]|nr:hypothetical protein [Nitrososphaerota archaeon]
MDKLLEMVEQAIERYNRYRSPEASARLVKAEGDRVIVEFSGSFCRSCGVYDWLEDLVYELKEVDPGYEARLIAWSEVAEERIVAEFEVKRL